MARVCEKNTCPRGIATHDPRFVAKYRGDAAHVRTLLEIVAAEVREHLASLGVRSLDDVIGRVDLLRERASARPRMLEVGVSLSHLLERAPPTTPTTTGAREPHVPAPMNDRLDALTRDVVAGNTSRASATLDIASTDRATLARLSGALATRSASERRRARARGEPAGRDQRFTLDEGSLCFTFEGSAGQGFAAFLVDGLDVTLVGEANDGVAKSISGGRVVVRPDPRARFAPEEQVIIGNTALYGATGGIVVVSGRAGDRFAVRNSGARAIVDGAGLHACAYMTGGTIAILGPVGPNAGAGMTGGTLFLPSAYATNVNTDTVRVRALDEGAQRELRALLEWQRDLAMSPRAARALDALPEFAASLVVVEPKGSALARRAA